MEERIEGVRVVRVPPLVRISRGMIAPRFGAAAARLIREHEAVVLNTPMFESAQIALLCRRWNKPLVVVHHGDLKMPAGAGNRIVERITTASMVVAARRAAAITTYNQDYGRHSDFLLPFRGKVQVIPPPVDIPCPDAGAMQLRAQLGLTDKKIIGFAGRFVEEKGGDVLLRALPQLLAAEPRAHLLFAAESNVVYEQFFERCRPLLDQVAPHVTWLGLLRDRQRLANFYAACDVLALPSRSDCFALVQAEAMLCGTPVVASDIPGAREAVRRTGMGRLVEPNDPAALAAALFEVLAAPDRYRRPAAEIAAHFDVTRTVSAYEALFAQACAPEREASPAPPAAVCARPVEESFAIEDRERLQQVLRNEADMAFRRRTFVLLDYLDLQAGERVLDGGCGMGFALLAMAALRQVRRTGIDSDWSRLQLARRAGTGAALAAADVSRLPFAAESFDKILLSEVLEHVADDDAALRELFRVLRPGGTLAISVPHANFPLGWDPFNKLWTGLGGPPLREGPLVGIWSLHRRLYWPEDLAQSVREAGFLIEQIENATHHSAPFAHFLVYGIGKPLLERGLLPARWRAHADRMAAGNGGGFDPFAVVRAVFRAFDRRNDLPAAGGKRTFVNVLVKARRPSNEGVGEG